MFSNGSNDKSQLASWIPNKDGTSMLQASVRSKIYEGDGFIEEKLVKYQLFWNYYNNKHWAKNNDKLLSFNYIRAIVDKVNNFMVSEEGFELVIKDTYGYQVSNELNTAYGSLLDYNWKQNNKKSLLKKILQTGGVTGDCYIFLYADTEAGFIRYQLMDTRTTVPIFEHGDYNKIKGYKVVQPLMKNDLDYIQKVYEYTKENTSIYYTKDTGDRAERFAVENTPNAYGFIPIVHIENIPMSDGYGGKSDVEDIVKLNKVYNEMAEDIKAIIDYYAQPTTIITGGTLGNVKRGINQIWSGLPAEAQVFNLSLGEDLSASMNYLTLLKNAMHDLTGVPEEILSKVQHISNTSASALQMMYQSLIQIADVKAVSYGDGIVALNKMTMKLFDLNFKDHPLYAGILNVVEKENLFGSEAYRVELFTNRFVTIPKFKYALPNDRLQMLNEINLELNLGIGSRKEAMERLGKGNISEILAQVEEDAEFKQKFANNGEEVIKPMSTEGGPQPNEKPSNLQED